MAWSLKAAGALFLLILAGYARRLWQAISRLRVAARPQEYPRAAATLWYERTIQALAKRGFPKSPAQTPEEFLQSIPDYALREPIARLTEHYERARFGDSPKDAACLPEVFAEVVTAVRR